MFLELRDKFFNNFSQLQMILSYYLFVQLLIIFLEHYNEKKI